MRHSPDLCGIFLIDVFSSGCLADGSTLAVKHVKVVTLHRPYEFSENTGERVVGNPPENAQEARDRSSSMTSSSSSLRDQGAHVSAQQQSARTPIPERMEGLIESDIELD